MTWKPFDNLSLKGVVEAQMSNNETILYIALDDNSVIKWDIEKKKTLSSIKGNNRHTYIWYL